MLGRAMAVGQVSTEAIADWADWIFQSAGCRQGCCPCPGVDHPVRPVATTLDGWGGAFAQRASESTDYCAESGHLVAGAPLEEAVDVMPVGFEAVPGQAAVHSEEEAENAAEGEL